jgi:hypothetical protein
MGVILGCAFRAPARLVAFLAEARLVAFLAEARFIAFLADAGRLRARRILPGRLTERRGDARLAERLACLARFAPFFAFLLFRFAIGFFLSEP